MDIKRSIERRIEVVTEYRGTQDLASVLTRGIPEKIGGDPKWLVAKSCMTVAEYLAWGQDGKPWKFMQGKPDTAERSIKVHRSVVQSQCKKIGLECDWSRIERPAQRSPKPYGERDDMTLLDAG